MIAPAAPNDIRGERKERDVQQMFLFSLLNFMSGRRLSVSSISANELRTLVLASRYGANTHIYS